MGTAQAQNNQRIASYLCVLQHIRWISLQSTKQRVSQFGACGRIGARFTP